MDLTNTLTMDPVEAEAKAASYRTIKAPSEEDQRIAAIFTALAAGKQVIDLDRAIIDAGVNDAGYPRLAAMSSTAAWCYLYTSVWQHNTKMEFRSTNTGRTNRNTIRVPKPADIPVCYGRMRSQVPIVPPQHRVRGWRSMVVVWEVDEWAMSPNPPGDPILCRPLLGALYTVEAEWDLTEVERMVLGQRP